MIWSLKLTYDQYLSVLHSEVLCSAFVQIILWLKQLQKPLDQANFEAICSPKNYYYNKENAYRKRKPPC